MTLGISWLDIKLGARMLVKYPGLALVGGLGMAVAIAIGTGSFAFFYSHMYPDIPLPDGNRIVALENWDVRANNEQRQALHDYAEWRRDMKTVQPIGAFRTVGRNLITGEGSPEAVPVAEITASGFRVAQVAPLLGRPLVDEDERQGAPPVVVIAYEVWKTRFEGHPRIIGREVRLGNTVHTIVGVMPEEFAFPVNHRFWVALRADPQDYERGEGPEIHIFGRLAPGVTKAQAQAELATLGRRTAAAFPKTHERLRPQVLPYTYPQMDIQDVALTQIGLMQLVVSLLLVVVCVNVSILVYARTATRQGEIAVRTALGASRRRIVSQLFAEALVLSAGAAVVGLALAQVGLRQGNAIMNAESGGAPFWIDYGLDLATVAYVAGLTLLAAVIVGVLPALQATGPRLQSSLRSLGGGTGMRLGRTWTVLIIAQVAIAVAALPAAVGAGWKQMRHAPTQPRFAAGEFLGAWMGIDTETLPAEDAGAPRQPSAVRFGAAFTELLRRLEPLLERGVQRALGVGEEVGPGASLPDPHHPVRAAPPAQLHERAQHHLAEGPERALAPLLGSLHGGAVLQHHALPADDRRGPVQPLEHAGDLRPPVLHPRLEAKRADQEPAAELLSVHQHLHPRKDGGALHRPSARVEERGVGVGDNHADQGVPLGEADAFDAAGIAAHGAGVGFRFADRDPEVGNRRHRTGPARFVRPDERDRDLGPGRIGKRPVIRPSAVA